MDKQQPTHAAVHQQDDMDAAATTEPAPSQADPQAIDPTGKVLDNSLCFHCDNGSFESMTLVDKKNQIHSLLPLVKLTDGPRKGVICVQAKLGGREVLVVLLKDIDKLLVMLPCLKDPSNPDISSVLQLLEHYAKYRDHHKFGETSVFAAANNQNLGMLVTLDPNAELAVPEGATFTHLYGRALTSYPVEQLFNAWRDSLRRTGKGRNDKSDLEEFMSVTRQMQLIFKIRSMDVEERGFLVEPSSKCCTYTSYDRSYNIFVWGPISNPIQKEYAVYTKAVRTEVDMNQAKRDALQQLDDTRQLNHPPSDPSTSSLASSSVRWLPTVATLLTLQPQQHAQVRRLDAEGQQLQQAVAREFLVTLPTRNQLLPLGQAQQSTSKRQSDHDLRRHRLQTAQSDWESGQEYEIGFKKSENWMPN
ncbi:hypothetical protein BC831DRAFT_433252 [Entophlyctis helioformis]|nr:hypothetical protein BC831DRAFT_433252 [Entophlyctis helioformis]